MKSQNQNNTNNDYSSIINWKSLHAKSDEFNNSTPFRYGYVENFFDSDFYEKLYDTYPKVDSDWYSSDQMYRKSMTSLVLKSDEETEFSHDDMFSKEWNEFKQYIMSDDFVKNMADYTNMPLKKTLHAIFIVLNRGDFLLPHVDGDGNYRQKLDLMLYFSKDWKKGDPGGTYLASGEDESTIFLEPYNLDNSMVCFEQTPASYHGVRNITKKVVRQALAVAFTI